MNIRYPIYEGVYRILTFMYRLSVFCAVYVALSFPIRCKPKQGATYFLVACIFFPFLIGRFKMNPHDM